MKATLCYLWVFLVCVCDSLLFSGKSIFYTNRKCLLSPRSAVLIRPLIPHLLFSVSSSFFFLSSFICLPQSTRLVSKVSSPAWPLLSLSTTVLTPSRVGSPILSEGTLQKKEKERKEIPSSSSSFASVASNRFCICFAFDWCGLWFAFLTIFLV